MPKKKKNALATSKSDFLAQVRKSKASVTKADSTKLAKALERKNPRLLFSMDATASRQAAWNIAKEITGAMFDAIPGELDVALAYHGGGFLQDVTPFTSKQTGFKRKLQQVRCRAGGTAFNPILDKAVNIPRLKALIYIGDCFEEDEDHAYFLANQLLLKGVRVFIFHDISSQEQGYSPEVVKALLEAISIYAGRGIKALRESKSESAQKLLKAIGE